MQDNQVNYDLEDRTLNFSKSIIDLVKNMPANQINRVYIDQLVRSAGSIGANYREANDALGKKDFYMRIRISRKEAKEAEYWLELLQHTNPEKEISPIISECNELVKIFSKIASHGT